MNNLSLLANRPFAFMFRYVRMHRAAHTIILLTVLAAVACSVTAQYGIKFLVDTLSTPNVSSSHVWLAFAVLASLIAADNLLWRVAGWIASKTFVLVTGDVRRDLFRHLTGHAPSFFADRLPGTLTSRVSATSNAVYTVENMFIWNVLPPCAATVAAGRPLHHEYADKAANVDGEMIDVIGNLPLVWSFGGTAREHRRFDGV